MSPGKRKKDDADRCPECGRKVGKLHKKKCRYLQSRPLGLGPTSAFKAAVLIGSACPWCGRPVGQQHQPDCARIVRGSQP